MCDSGGRCIAYVVVIYHRGALDLKLELALRQPIEVRQQRRVVTWHKRYLHFACVRTYRVKQTTLAKKMQSRKRAQNEMCARLLYIAQTSYAQSKGNSTKAENTQQTTNKTIRKKSKKKRKKKKKEIHSPSLYFSFFTLAYLLMMPPTEPMCLFGTGSARRTWKKGQYKNARKHMTTTHNQRIAIVSQLIFIKYTEEES